MKPEKLSEILSSPLLIKGTLAIATGSTELFMKVSAERTRIKSCKFYCWKSNS